MELRVDISPMTTNPDEGRSFASRVDTSTLWQFPSVLNNTSLHFVFNWRVQSDIMSLFWCGVWRPVCLKCAAVLGDTQTEDLWSPKSRSQPPFHQANYWRGQQSFLASRELQGVEQNPFGVQGIRTALPPTIAWGAALWHNSCKFWLCNTSSLAR